jgi:hypothetical protein
LNGAAGRARGAGSALGSDEAGDGNMDKATRVAIVRAYEVDRGDGGGDRGTREGGEVGGEGGGGVGFLSHQTWSQGARTGGSQAAARTS